MAKGQQQKGGKDKNTKKSEKGKNKQPPQATRVKKVVRHHGDEGVPYFPPTPQQTAAARPTDEIEISGGVLEMVGIANDFPGSTKYFEVADDNGHKAVFRAEKYSFDVPDEETGGKKKIPAVRYYLYNAEVGNPMHALPVSAKDIPVSRKQASKIVEVKKPLGVSDESFRRQMVIINFLRSAVTRAKIAEEAKMAAIAAAARNMSAVETTAPAPEEIAAARAFNKEVTENAKAALTAKNAAAEAARAERERVKQEKIARIRARKVPSVFYEDGGRVRSGAVVVVGSEWEMFADNTFALSAELYNDETHECGRVIETFYVSKTRGGRPERRGVKPVSLYRGLVGGPGAPKSKKAGMPEAKQIVTVKIGDDQRSVLVFASSDEIKQARNAGLNSGAYVGCFKPDGTLEVYQLSGKETKTVGQFKKKENKPAA